MIKALKDPVASIRLHYAEVLGQLLAAACQKDARKRDIVKKKIGKAHFEVLGLSDAIDWSPYTIP